MMITTGRRIRPGGSALALLLFAAQLGAQDAGYTSAQVAAHANAQSCWVSIDGRVYDLTRYLTRHREFKYDLTKWCGQDASDAWSDKDGRGKQHSRKAHVLLKKYEIGALVTP